jgi:hypothetical protein
MRIILRLPFLFSVHAVFAALVLAVSHGVGAAVLGEPVSISAIGEPVKVEIAVLGGDLSRVAECLRIAPRDGDDGLPWLREGRITAIGRGPSARVRIEGRSPVFEPVLKLALEDLCTTRLRREYTLLLSFPAAPQAPRDLASASPPMRANATRDGLSPAPARSARPAIRNEESRPAPTPRATRRAVPNVPDIGANPPASNRARPAGGDRLVLGDAPPGEDGGLQLSLELKSLDRIGTTSNDERDRLRREQSVALAIDRTIVTQLELNERIRQLEETQRSMVARTRELAELPPQDKRAADVARPGRDWLYAGALVATLSALLAAALLWMRRRTNREFDAESFAPSGAVGSPYPKDHASANRTATLPAALPIPTSGEARGLPGVSFKAAELDPQSEVDIPIVPISLEDTAAEEHESAIELAEIMMGFGRVQGAADTLAEFIESNPKKAVTPWLKLLEVYRAADLRNEFDTLARQLNKTFNVKSVTWDTFDEARRAGNSIEQMSHIANTVTQLWGTPDCQAYLENLLRDNRDGTREGFPLSVIDEILMLAAVLEEELGPYRGPQSTNAAIAA